MNDLDLAEEIEQVILAGNKVGIPLASIIKMGFTSQQWNEIIAALRRGSEPCPHCGFPNSLLRGRASGEY